MSGHPLENIDLLLWSLVLIIFFIIIAYFIIKYRKMEAGTRAFIIGVIIFATCFTISRIFEITRRLLFPLYSYDTIYLGNFTLDGINLILRLTYYLFIWVGIGIFYFVFEKYVMNQRTKYILFITSIVTFFLSMAMYYTGGADLVFVLYGICFFIVGLFPTVLFAYLSRKSMNRAQQIAWIVMIAGFLFLLLGVLGDMPEGYIVTRVLNYEFIRYFTTLAQAAGAALMAYSLSIIYKYV